VPTVSFMIASLGGYAFHSFATGLGGIVQGTAHASAGDIARGNFNAGQVNYRNISAGNTSFGGFSGWTTSVFMTSMDQHQTGNITKQGKVVTLNSGSVGQAMALMSKLNEPSRQILSSALAIAGMKGTITMVYNEETGQLQRLSIRGGEGGFAVEYDGSGKLMVEKGGVKHGSIELDEKGEIKGFESSVQIGGMSLEYMKTKAKEISETAEAYRQVGEAFKTIASKGIKAVDLKALRDNLSKIVQSDFASFLEAARAWGLDKDIIKEILKTVGLRHGHEYRTADSTEVEASGGVGIGTGGSKGNSGSIWPIQIGGSLSGGFQYRDDQIKSMSAYLTKDDKEGLVNKFIDALQNKLGQRSSDSQAKKTDQSYTQGKEVSEEASNSKVYEVAESFGKKAGEMLTYAERLQASLKEDPLNYYAKLKYEEALRQGKSKGEAVRYAMEEVAKLRSNPEALEKWLNEFAEGKGIRSPKVDENKLEKAKEEVPKTEDIQKKGQELSKQVGEQIANAQRQIEQRKGELERYTPPKAKLFNLQAPTINLQFDPNDPKFQANAKYAQQWFINQPNTLQRPVKDLKDTALRWGDNAKQFVIDLGKDAITTFNKVDQARQELERDPKYRGLMNKP